MARFDLTGYGHKNQGQGLWYTPYTVSPGYGTAGSNAAPLSIRTTEYDIDRKGLIGNVYVDLGSPRDQRRLLVPRTTTSTRLADSTPRP
jgi:iron complex outermembrane receptor protein